ncbi:unnamed protein product [Cyclocybe aegerita]|uniref:WW domain-containing protein n=1 Tax=Cyclocybe aegerita TaxID=1973307 RepID=A0A8S0WBW9_CYCAE|nr:unnamed protein product [Cyclocybe aegerita]
MNPSSQFNEEKISSGSLIPTIPANTGRYEVRVKVERSYTTIQPGMFLSHLPTYLPPKWCETVHPEGQRYFHRTSGLCVVTDSCLQEAKVAEQIRFWAEKVEQLAKERDCQIPETAELYLQLSGEDCNYYLVDHATRTIFWLEPCDTAELGLHPTISASHLQLVLETQYWSHVESFCMHRALPEKAINDLILIFTHGLADTLSSALSTFPYESKECEKYLNLLKSSRDQISEGCIITMVARLWGVITYARYETHYGQEQARLSRDTSILVDEVSEVQWTKPILSFVTLRTYEPYLRRLDGLYVDRFVYGCDWDSFMASCIKTWQHIFVASVGLLLLHVFCFFLPLSPSLACVSSGLSSLALMTSVLLIYRHEELDKAGAAPAHDFLQTICSTRFKFQGVALTYAAPKAFFLWSLVTFFSQWAILLCQHLSFHHAAICVAIVLAVLVSFQYATSSVKLTRPALFTKTKDEASMV